MKLTQLISMISISLLLCGCTGQPVEKNYEFDGNISEEVLRNYLSRAVTFNGLSMSDTFEDDMRMLRKLQPKYVGRVSYVWNGHTDYPGRLAIETDPDEIYAKAKIAVDALHEADPDIIAQACLFEIVDSCYVSKIEIPEYVFAQFGQKYEKRNFDYSKMLYTDPALYRKFHDHWGKGQSVPDLSKVETQMLWFFQATTYINMGYESLHCGQIHLMNRADDNGDRIFDFLNMLRDYAKVHGRRHMVMFDAHTHGVVSEDGHLLFDFHAFPLRPQEVVGKPYECTLEIGALDGNAIYKDSKGGITPSGWSCEHLPYIVEFDNSGTEWMMQGRSDNKVEHFPWGWEEINWFAHCPDAYRGEWLTYAVNWLKENDPDGYVQMPLKIPTEDRYPNGLRVWYRANNLSTGCPLGFSDEDAILKAWEQLD